MNIFGKELTLKSKEVEFRGVVVVVTETTDEDYHQYVTLPMSGHDPEDPDEVADFNREAVLRMLAVSLAPGLKQPVEEIYKDLRIPGKYPRSAIQTLINAMGEVNSIQGNSQTITSD